jgi:hypothetical protein
MTSLAIDKDAESVASSQLEKMRNDAGPAQDISAGVLVQESSFLLGK